MDRSLQHAFDAEEVMAYLDGELEPQRAAMLASHLEDCSECQNVAEKLRGVTEFMLSFGVQPSPETLVSTVLGALNSAQMGSAALGLEIRRKWYLNWRSLFERRVAWTCAAAVLVLALVIGIPILHRSREVVSNLTAPASRSIDSLQELSAPVAAREDKRSQYMQQAQLSENLEANSSASIVRPEPPPSQADGVLAAPESIGSMIVQTATLNIVAKNYDEASAAIEKLTKTRGGYIEKLDAKAQTGNARELSVALRVPAKQLELFLADLRQLGHVEQESQSNEEVSAQYVDLQARLRVAQATERRLIELLGVRTGRLEDVLDAERELARVRGEIESMQGQSALLAHQVTYASVQVELDEEYHEKLHSDSTGTKLWNAGITGLQDLKDGVVGVLIFALNYGLVILFWLGIIALPTWLVWRRFRPHRASQV